MHDPELEPPVNPMPPAVVLVFLAIAGIEAALSLGEAGMIGGREAIGWRLALIRDYDVDLAFDRDDIRVQICFACSTGGSESPIGLRQGRCPCTATTTKNGSGDSRRCASQLPV